MSASIVSASDHRLRPYSAYKHSGVEWLGIVPAHWDTKRLRFTSRVNPASPPKPTGDNLVTFLPMESIGTGGDVDLTETREYGEVCQGYTGFRDGDVVVAKITPCFENGKGVLLSRLRNGVGFGTTELHVVRAGRNLDRRFLWWLTVARPFREFGTTEMTGAAGQQRVPESFLLNWRIPLPPLPEQCAIAAFLDRETARIDALIAKKRRLIELLGERRRATIHRLVTGGLVAGLTLKPSAVAWIGDVPAHWRVVRNKVIYCERDERSEDGREELLTVSHITGVTPRSEKDVTMFLAETNEGYKRVCAGDLVINTMWAWMGALGFSRCDGIVSPSYNVYTLRPQSRTQYVPEYLHMLYRTEGYVADITSRSEGVWTSRLRLYPEAWMNMLTVAPPRDEQRAIVDSVSRELSCDLALTAKLQASVDAMRDHRNALVASAVTGKVDVREVAV